MDSSVAGHSQDIKGICYRRMSVHMSQHYDIETKPNKLYGFSFLRFTCNISHKREEFPYKLISTPRILSNSHLDIP